VIFLGVQKTTVSNFGDKKLIFREKELIFGRGRDRVRGVKVDGIEKIEERRKKMKYREELEKLSRGEVKGARIGREGEWVVKTIAIGFLLIGEMLEGKEERKEEEKWEERKNEGPKVQVKGKRGRPKTKEYPEVEKEEGGMGVVFANSPYGSEEEEEEEEEFNVREEE